MAKAESSARNRLYYGDNLDVLKRYIASESVDLVYLDPPFKSDQDYNVLFLEHTGALDAAQISAFEDTWRWSIEAEEAFRETVKGGGAPSRALAALRGFLGQSDMMAYLAMMAPRLVELHRVLKPTGSLYLHCDPTASHYLKMVLDAVFGPGNFRNEIVWRRTGSHNKTRRFGPIHDVLLFYTKSDQYVWNYPKRPYMKGHVEQAFVERDGKYYTNYSGNVLTGSGMRGGESGAPWRGFNPSAKGRHWAVPKALVEDLDEDLDHLTQHQKFDRLTELGHVKIVPGCEWPVYEREIKPTDGQYLSDIWAAQPHTSGTVFGFDGDIDEDVRWLATRDQERLGYPTQKPLGLLGRIIKASSNPGDLVLDPFCGCGTTIDAAERLGRRWIGVDITHLAIGLIKHRLLTQFGSTPKTDYEVVGEPVSLSGAIKLATEDRHQFEHWALGLVGARASAKKKGADHGIDGRLFFYDDRGNAKEVIVSVKSGRTSVRDVRDLRGVIERDKAALGVLVTLEESTQPMRVEAIAAGIYDSPWGTSHPRLQILTIKELLDGKNIDRPPTKALKAPVRARTPTAGEAPLFDHTIKSERSPRQYPILGGPPKRAKKVQPKPKLEGDRKPTKKKSLDPDASEVPTPAHKRKRR